MAHNEGAPALPSLRSMIRRLQATGDKNAQNQPHLKLRIIIAVPEATYMGASSRVYDSAWLLERLAFEEREECAAAPSVWGSDQSPVIAFQGSADPFFHDLATLGACTIARTSG